MKTKRQTADIAFKGSLTVHLLLLFSLLVLTIVWRRERRNEILEKEQIICQPCLALRHVDTLLSGCIINGTDRCCCKASAVINSVVIKSMKDKFREYRARGTASVFQSGCVSQPKAMGKVAGIDFGSLKKDTRERDLVYWDMSDQSILESIYYVNARFTIRQPGHYYVFSQIKYEHDPDAVQKTQSRQSHSLHRYSLRTREQKLLESTRTYAELHLQVNNGTSYIGSVFKFETNDEIMIKSSHTHKLSGNDRENFFGLFIL